jgi:hypothetical protein
MEQIMDPIRADIQDIKDDIRDMKSMQGQVWKLAARVSNVSPLIPPLLMTNLKNHNLSLGAGDDARFEVVPFANGRNPTKDPVSFCHSPHICYELMRFSVNASTIFHL